MAAGPTSIPTCPVFSDSFLFGLLAMPSPGLQGGTRELHLPEMFSRASGCSKRSPAASLQLDVPLDQRVAS